MKRDLVALGLVCALGLAACSEKSATAPPATPTLALTLGSATGQITQAGTLAVTVNVTRGNFEGAVSVTASGMGGLTAVALSIPGSSTSGTLTLTADAAAVPGNGTLAITAAGPNGAPTTTATLALTVNVRGTFTLSAAPAVLSLTQGGAGNRTVTVNRAGNFIGNVTLAAQAIAGLVATITPSSLSGTSSTATLAVTASGIVGAGSYTVTVTGTTPGLANQITTVNVTVTAPAAPPFSGTIFLDPDIITPSDPTTFVGLTYSGQGSRTMFDRRVNNWITVNAFLFSASFNDGLTVEVQVNPEFGTVVASQTQAQLYAGAIGRLPTALRRDVRTVWIHQGVQPFGGGNNNILIHVGQADLYVAAGILEETLVHEAAHTSLDASHAAAPGWLAAQSADPTFISTYARDFPTREDIAESFLPWLAVRYRTDRISAQLLATILATIPNRLAYFDSLGLPMHPIR